MSKANFPNGGGNTIGNVHGVSGTSMGHNSDKTSAGAKPTVAGNDNPGGHKPPRAPEDSVPMPK